MTYPHKVENKIIYVPLTNKICKTNFPKTQILSTATQDKYHSTDIMLRRHYKYEGWGRQMQFSMWQKVIGYPDLGNQMVE